MPNRNKKVAFVDEQIAIAKLCCRMRVLNDLMNQCKDSIDEVSYSTHFAEYVDVMFTLAERVPHEEFIELERQISGSSEYTFGGELPDLTW